jgi:hypothetical protein
MALRAAIGGARGDPVMRPAELQRVDGFSRNVISDPCRTLLGSTN